MIIKDIVFEELDDYEGWYVSGGGEADTRPLEAKALELQPEASAKGMYCICGLVDEGYGLYLVPKKGMRYVIESFYVGSHAGEEPENVYKQIAEADRINPLIPIFADEEALRAIFTNPVTDDVIELLKKSIYSAEAMGYEEEEIERFVRTFNAVHFWWD